MRQNRLGWLIDCLGKLLDYSVRRISSSYEVYDLIAIGAGEWFRGASLTITGVYGRGETIS